MDLTVMTPIRTLLDDAIEQVLISLGQFTAVYYVPDRIPQEQSSFPYVAVLTDGEIVKNDNQYRTASFNLHIVVAEQKSNSREMHRSLIKLAALINNAFINRDNAAFTYATKFIEASNGLDIHYNQDGLGAAVLNYEVEYKTARGNPFFQSPQ